MTWEEFVAMVPSSEDRARRAEDLLGRAALVRADGWEPYRAVWSSGEVSGTALVLGDVDELSASHETEQSALETWAANLWGIEGGLADAEQGLVRTRTWFAEVRSG